MAKRANGEGSIFRRSDGRWVATIVLERGRRKSFYGRTRHDVGAKLTAALKSRQDGLPIPSERQTVSNFLRGWLEGIRASVRPTTWDRYEALLRCHAIPAIGRISLARLTPDRLQRLFSELLSAGLSPASVRQTRAILRKALNDAARWGSVGRNVAALTSAPRVPRRPITALSPQQARAFLDEAASDELAALYYLAITTGMRQGELLALKWPGVDLEGGTVQIRSTLHRTQEGFVFSEPKTGQSRRQISLTQTAKDAIKRHRAAQAEQRLRVGGYWQDQDLVFTNEVGGPIETTTSTRMNGLVRFLRDLRRCQSMFLFIGVGRPQRLPLVLSQDRILGDVWRKCGDDHSHSLIE